MQVRNFAIIDEVEVEFSSGMTVLTGETGAGKSILVDALALVLGDRGGAGVVRNGAKRAEFVAEFDLSDQPGARRWLEEQALDVDDECLLRRVVGSDGRSRAFINGNAVPLQALKILGEMLLDIHGQHFHQSLSKRPVQRQLLDHFIGCGELLASVGENYERWRALADELDELQSADADRASRIDLLSFQCQELESLALQAGELEELMRDRARYQHSGRLAEGVGAALLQLADSDDGGAYSILADVRGRIEQLADIDEALNETLMLLRDAEIQTGEAVDVLRRYGDGIDMDPAQRDRVEERLDAIQDLARKHRCEPEDLPALLGDLQQQLQQLTSAEERGDQLELAAKEARDSYAVLAAELSAARSKGAGKFSEAVTAAMADLGMAGGQFDIGLNSLSIDKGAAHGIDEVDFLISANPGQALQPLAKVASGGELSRMSLSIQVIASDGSAIPTMVFDEVDSGVGGGIAEMVGTRLGELGQSRQVLCVTHLPQVASIASNHFRIVKITDGKSTRTAVTPLTIDERVEELARMLGGVEITEKTRAHAREMLQKSSTDGKQAAV